MMKYIIAFILGFALLPIYAQKANLYNYLQNCTATNAKTSLFDYLQACKTAGAKGELYAFLQQCRPTETPDHLRFLFPVGSIKPNQAWIYTTNEAFAFNNGGGIKIDTAPRFIFKRGVMNGKPTIIGMPETLEPWQEQAFNNGGGIKIDTAPRFVFKKTKSQNAGSPTTAFLVPDRKPNVSLYKKTGPGKFKCTCNKGYKKTATNDFPFFLDIDCGPIRFDSDEENGKWMRANEGSPHFATIMQLYEDGEENGVLIDFVTLDETGKTIATQYLKVPFEKNLKAELYNFLQNCQKPASPKNELYSFLQNCKAQTPNTYLLAFIPKGKTQVKYEMYISLPPQADVQALFAQSLQAEKYDMTIKTAPIPTKIPKNLGVPVYDPQGDLLQIVTSEGGVLDFGEKIPTAAIYGLQGAWGIALRTYSNGKGTRNVATTNTGKQGLL